MSPPDLSPWLRSPPAVGFPSQTPSPGRVGTSMLAQEGRQGPQPPSCPQCCPPSGTKTSSAGWARLYPPLQHLRPRGGGGGPCSRPAGTRRSRPRAPAHPASSTIRAESSTGPRRGGRLSSPWAPRATSAVRPSGNGAAGTAVTGRGGAQPRDTWQARGSPCGGRRGTGVAVRTSPCRTQWGARGQWERAPRSPAPRPPAGNQRRNRGATSHLLLKNPGPCGRHRAGLPRCSC